MGEYNAGGSAIRVYGYLPGASTLRSHFPLEIDSITQLLEQDTGQPVDAIFLVPAFFEGGRITRDDTHYLWDGRAYIPTAETEFARDAVFGYTSSHLPTYIEEKTNGLVHAQDVRSLMLSDLRHLDANRLAQLLTPLRRRQYVVVNAENYADLAPFAESVLALIASGKTFVFQSAASLVKALTQTPDQPLLGKEICVNAGPGLFVVGSHVNKTSAQLQRLLTSTLTQPIEIEVEAILTNAQAQRDLVLAQIASAVTDQKTPVVYTSRRELRFPSSEERLHAGQVIAQFLAALVEHVPFCPSYLVAKGGITSHEILGQGLRVPQARVLGQILPGVPVVSLPGTHRFGAMPYIIFPGNVGDADALYQVWQCLA